MTINVSIRSLNRNINSIYCRNRTWADTNTEYCSSGNNAINRYTRTITRIILIRIIFIVYSSYYII